MFDGLDVDGAFTKALVFHSNGDNATFKNGRIGNVTDEKGALVSGTDFTFDNVVFHDVRATNPSVHNECIYAIGVPGMTVRNSLFHDCATMDLFFTYGTWWAPLPPAYGSVTLENNVFGHPTRTTAPGTTTASMWPTPPTAAARSTAGRSATTPSRSPPTSSTPPPGGSRWVGNLGGWNCVAGMRYSHNVGQKCGGSDKAVSPRGVHGRRCRAALGWIDPGALDFRLRAGSPAINAADPNDHPALDRDGFVRDGRPDAGAHEFGAGPPGAAGGGGGGHAGRRAPAEARGRGPLGPAAAARDLQAPAALLRALGAAAPQRVVARPAWRCA